MSEVRFWQTIASIDQIAERFCLQLHRAVNESPRRERTIECVAEGQIFDVEGYRPSIATIVRHYPGSQHWVERHRPDVRGREPFFYKLDGERPGLLAQIPLKLRRVLREHALARRLR